MDTVLHNMRVNVMLQSRLLEVDTLAKPHYILIYPSFEMCHVRNEYVYWVAFS